jgi:MFS family permease
MDLNKSNESPLKSTLSAKDRKFLNLSSLEGALAAVMQSGVELYLNPFAIFMGATPFYASLVATLPPLIGSLLMVNFINRVAKIVRRTFVISLLSVFQALICWLLASLPFVLGKTESAVYLLIVAAIAYFFLASLLGSVWNSLMGDIVATETRGAFFGIRGQRVQASLFFTTVFAGVLLQYFTDMKHTEYGYLIIFLIAGFARCGSAWLLTYYDNPLPDVSPANEFTFRQFLERSYKSNFLRFVVFIGAFNLAIHVSAPYVAYYLIKDQGYSYLQFMSITSMSLLSQLGSLKLWGKIADDFGTRRVVTISCIGNCFVDLFFLFSSNYYVILFSRILSGTFWAGFVLGTSTFLFDSVTPGKRARCFTYQNFISTAAVLLGSSFGGLVINMIPSTVGIFADFTGSNSKILLLFVISTVLRILVLSFIVSFAEVRDIADSKSLRLILKVSVLRPFSGFIYSIIPSSKK